ncbi:MAG: aminotransferase class V-fold PLP-dependent enzyme [Minisyncoccia bacterium]|jgi:cysteine desulfurase/selenocysteine lyase
MWLGKTKEVDTQGDFGYLAPGSYYFDSACQTLRPSQVIEAQRSYFETFNACGGRVSYPWGEKVDEITEHVRTAMLDYFELSAKEYAVSFTLNTTYGINLLLSQLPRGKYARVVTSEIEHNSVFLPTISLAKRLGIPRVILSRAEDGALRYEPSDLERAIVVVNARSNFDAQALHNLHELVQDTHAKGGIVILDAAQAATHEPALLRGCGADAIVASAHKMYGPSLGVMTVRIALLNELELSFVGGGMVRDVEEDSFLPSIEPHDRLEPGLQNYSGIVGFDAAMPRLAAYEASGKEAKLTTQLSKSLSELPLTLITSKPSSIVSFYSEKVDSNRLALFLAGQGVMVRSGYFCCHYYLQKVKQYPPLVRFSLGAHNTEEDITHAISIVKTILNNI